MAINTKAGKKAKAKANLLRNPGQQRSEPCNTETKHLHTKSGREKGGRAAAAGSEKLD